jgi:hypothetical protein
MESGKEVSGVRKKIGLMVIPLPQGLHTQHESAATLAQRFPEDMSLPHRPPVLEVDGQRSE